MIVENRAGAGGMNGSDLVAKSPPDGYTILQNTNGQAISPAIYRTLPFDTLKDFIPVTQLVATSTVLVANPKLPAKTVQELIALAKAHPGKLNYGMTGVGNSLHLTMEMFKRAAGIDIQAVPYRGDALLNPALIAGEIDVAIVPIGTIVPLIEGGQLRALAVNSAKRSPVLPDVPTVSEGAIPGFEAAGWQGYFVPARHTARDRRAHPARSRDGHRAARHAGAPQGNGQRAGGLDVRRVRRQVPRRRRQVPAGRARGGHSAAVAGASDWNRYVPTSVKCRTIAKAVMPIAIAAIGSSTSTAALRPLDAVLPGVEICPPSIPATTFWRSSFARPNCSDDAPSGPVLTGSPPRLQESPSRSPADSRSGRRTQSPRSPIQATR